MRHGSAALPGQWRCALYQVGQLIPKRISDPSAGDAGNDGEKALGAINGLVTSFVVRSARFCY